MAGRCAGGRQVEVKGGCAWLQCKAGEVVCKGRYGATENTNTRAGVVCRQVQVVRAVR